MTTCTCYFSLFSMQVAEQHHSKAPMVAKAHWVEASRNLEHDIILCLIILLYRLVLCPCDACLSKKNHM